jgi:hypothetical protein
MKSLISKVVITLLIFNAVPSVAFANEKKLRTPYEAWLKTATPGEFGKRYKFVGAYAENPKNYWVGIPLPVYVTISDFAIYDQAKDCPNGILTSIERDCRLRYGVKVKVENLNEDYEATTPFIKLWCKDSKQNSNTYNPYSDGLNLGSESLPPLSEELGTEIILLPRDMDGPMKCENPGLFVKSYNGATKSAKKNGFISSLFFPLNKLLLINPNVLNQS